MLEVRQGQAQEMPEHLAPEHRVHAVSRVQHQILPQPPHRRVEEEKHPQTHGDRDQGALGLVHHHLVDYDLSTKGRGEPDQLNEEGRKEDVAPDALVLEELQPEPAEAEFRGRGRALGLGRLRSGLVPHEKHVALERILHQTYRRRLRRLAAGDEIEQPLRIALDEDRRLRRIARKKTNAGECGLGEFAFAGAETQQVDCFDKLPDRMRRRKPLQEQRRVERNAVDLA